LANEANETLDIFVKELIHIHLAAKGTPFGFGLINRENFVWSLYISYYCLLVIIFLGESNLQRVYLGAVRHMISRHNWLWFKYFFAKSWLLNKGRCDVYQII